MTDQGLPVQYIRVLCVLPSADGFAVVRYQEEAESPVEADLPISRI